MKNIDHIFGPTFSGELYHHKNDNSFSRLKRIMTPHLIGLIHPQFQIKLCHVTWRHGRREGGSSNLFKVVSKVSKAISKLNYKNNFFCINFFLYKCTYQRDLLIFRFDRFKTLPRMGNQRDLFLDLRFYKILLRMNNFEMADLRIYSEVGIWHFETKFVKC